MGRAESIIKYTLCSFNVFIMFLGLVMVIIGVVFLLDWKVVKDALKPHLTVAPWLFIIMGTLMLVIATFGFYGPLFNNKIMVFTYVIFLLVIIFLQAVIAILLLASHDTAKRRIMKFGNDIFKAAPNSFALRSITNSVQEQFECCGWSGVQDYGLDAFLALPGSCCRETEPYGYLIEGKCNRWVASPACKRIIGDIYETKFGHIVAIAIFIACLQIICIVAALFLTNFGRKKKRSCLPFSFLKF